MESIFTCCCPFQIGNARILGVHSVDMVHYRLVFWVVNKLLSHKNVYEFHLTIHRDSRITTLACIFFSILLGSIKLIHTDKHTTKLRNRLLFALHKIPIFSRKILWSVCKFPCVSSAIHIFCHTFSVFTTPIGNAPATMNSSFFGII
ncbi:hypothetical protein MT325_m623R [Paramecium bursaria chlorella virus MT325]|uniref:Uncharacterized protein m623R n=1 Tax=Paramecium bursaria Chlorella virus MT325 TaxID=346932 RepID=A7IV03_PBCVM|nr:hypothetical protein MT325_m623R [Paramecium bursaria chlorella virus MT325]